MPLHRGHTRGLVPGLAPLPWQVVHGAGLCVAHDFCLPAHRPLRKVLADQIGLTRSFYLVRHQGDQRSERLNRLAALLSEGLREEVARLESLT